MEQEEDHDNNQTKEPEQEHKHKQEDDDDEQEEEDSFHVLNPLSLLLPLKFPIPLEVHHRGHGGPSEEEQNEREETTAKRTKTSDHEHSCHPTTTATTEAATTETTEAAASGVDACPITAATPTTETEDACPTTAATPTTATTETAATPTTATTETTATPTTATTETEDACPTAAATATTETAAAAKVDSAEGPRSTAFGAETTMRTTEATTIVTGGSSISDSSTIISSSISGSVVSTGGSRKRLREDDHNQASLVGEKHVHGDDGGNDGASQQETESGGIYAMRNVIMGQEQGLSGTTFTREQLQQRLSMLRQGKVSITRQLREYIRNSRRCRFQDELLCPLLMDVDRQIEGLFPIALIQRRLRTIVGYDPEYEEAWVRVISGNIPESIKVENDPFSATWTSALEKDYPAPNRGSYLRRVITSSSLIFELIMLFSLKASIHSKMTSVVLKGQITEDLIRQEGHRETFRLRDRLKEDEWGKPIDRRGAFSRENLTVASKHMRAAAGCYGMMAYTVAPLLNGASMGTSPPEKYSDILVGFRDLSLGCSISCMAYLAAEKKSSSIIISRLLSGVSHCAYSAYLRLRSDSEASGGNDMKHWYQVGRPAFSDSVSSEPQWEELSGATVDALIAAPEEFRGISSLPRVSLGDVRAPTDDEDIAPAPLVALSRMVEEYSTKLANSCMIARALSHEYAARECQRALDHDTGVSYSLLGYAYTGKTTDSMVCFQSFWAHAEASRKWFYRTARAFGAVRSLTTARGDSVVDEPFKSLYESSKRKTELCNSLSNSVYHTSCPQSDPLVVPRFSGSCLFQPSEAISRSASRRDTLILSFYSRVASFISVNEAKRENTRAPS